MTPQERDLLTQLIDRLRAAPPQQKDAEAEQLIRDAVRLVPDAPYLLAQTVLMQDFALNQAQQRIQDLERRVAQPAAQGGIDFAGVMLGIGWSAFVLWLPERWLPSPNFKWFRGRRATS